MAYNYFTKQLIDKNILDLSTVFPDKQKIAQDRGGVSYTLTDIVLYLQDASNDFNDTKIQFIELDNAIRQIIINYYKSIDVDENPIEAKDKEKSDTTSTSEAYIVKDGKTKSKNVGMSAPDDKIKKFKGQIETLQGLIDDGLVDEKEKQDYIQLYKNKLSADEELAAEGEEYFIKRVEIIKEFIEKNSK